jgi:HAD superfamily hydrolase (TIGR01509 family)
MTPLVIFDCDGVLIDSEIIASLADAEELTSSGYPITQAEVIRRFTGVPQPDMLAAVERDLGRALPLDLPARIDARVLSNYRSSLRAVDDVAQTVATLPYRYCVASSSKPSKLGLGLIETRLFDLFYPHIFSTVLVERGKPAPDLFLYAARAMQSEPRHCVVVEDSIAGITAAKAAGMHALGFVGGTHCAAPHAGYLIQAGADRIFDDFRRLPALVEGLLAEAQQS